MIAIFLILFSSAKTPDFAGMETAYKKLILSKVPTRTLCTKAPMPLPLPLPKKITGDEITTVKLWASWCGPCLESMKETWKTDKDTLWVNVDREPGVAKSCEFLRANLITVPIYHDYTDNIHTQIGTGLALPMRLEIKNNKVVSTKLGYAKEFTKTLLPNLGLPSF